ncbi:nicotinate-nucleotide--dimethylbenzimidazole phosphoribosyltransferase [Thiorhodococcus mannitoliphagus]
MGGQKVYEGLVRGGDFEITAMVGAMIACAQMGLEVVVWGAQGKTAAELAACLCPGAKPWLRRSASSSEGVEVAATPTARESLALTGS